MNIGLFGGTFNPIHYGHLRPILEIQEAFCLDTVYFIPSAVPPHKSPHGIADAGDRCQMIRLAIAGQQGFLLSDAELDRPGPSYAIDTVVDFASKFPEGTRLYLVVGLDAFLEIDTWKSYPAFFEQVPFIVMERPVNPAPPPPDPAERIEAFLKKHISEGYRLSENRSCYIHDRKHPVFRGKITALEISSTKIRNLVKQGHSIRYLVPDAVAAYIRSKGLYR